MCSVEDAVIIVGFQNGFLVERKRIGALSGTLCPAVPETTMLIPEVVLLSPSIWGVFVH